MWQVTNIIEGKTYPVAYFDSENAAKAFVIAYQPYSPFPLNPPEPYVMSKFVYVVTNDNNFGIEIDAIFLDENEAINYYNEREDKDHCVEITKYPIGRPAPPEPEPTKNLYIAKITIDDGILTEDIQEETASYADSYHGKTCPAIANRIIDIKSLQCPKAKDYILAYSTESQEHANKLAVEARQKHLRTHKMVWMSVAMIDPSEIVDRRELGIQYMEEQCKATTLYNEERVIIGYEAQSRISQEHADKVALDLASK